MVGGDGDSRERGDDLSGRRRRRGEGRAREKGKKGSGEVGGEGRRGDGTHLQGPGYFTGERREAETRWVWGPGGDGVGSRGWRKGRKLFATFARGFVVVNDILTSSYLSIYKSYPEVIRLL